MKTRVRYVALENGNMVSKQPIIAGGEVLAVTLMPSSLSYTIADATNGAVLETGEAVSMQMLKIKVKKALRSRGAVFGDEIRNRESDSNTAVVL